MDKLITILGPTATGKTTFAAHLAKLIDAEIISADSRQVYRGMDLGTGKDIEDYTIDGYTVPYHLVDIKDPGYEYNVYEYQKDFLKAYQDIITRGKIAIQCGGTGMYLSSVVQAYDLKEVPVDQELRKELEGMTDKQLISILKSLDVPHNTTDLDNRKRLLRAVEIAMLSPRIKSTPFPKMDHVVFGIKLEREVVRERVTRRLTRRLKEGMTAEVESLLKSGVSAEQLMFYGLEYKYLTQYVIGEIEKNDMFQKLNSAIHQFSKRQMTWFRRMEKQGVTINWIDGMLPMEGKLQESLKILASH
ncbi:MAG: tRNA (adenosine(37)-N6)-dimethylallyltransferase MiaA [Bacteroidetes bacterium]|nr:tRNA (adenosine(37)-N6)-dimethylallyltransferase MiaA [Bacteroidota bacterium]